MIYPDYHNSWMYSSGDVMRSTAVHSSTYSKHIGSGKYGLQVLVKIC